MLWSDMTECLEKAAEIFYQYAFVDEVEELKLEAPDESYEEKPAQCIRQR